MLCLLKDPSSPPEKDYYLSTLLSNSSKTKIIWRTHLYFVVNDKLNFIAFSLSGSFAT